MQVNFVRFVEVTKEEVEGDLELLVIQISEMNDEWFFKFVCKSQTLFEENDLSFYRYAISVSEIETTFPDRNAPLVLDEIEERRLVFGLSVSSAPVGMNADSEKDSIILIENLFELVDIHFCHPFRIFDAMHNF